MNLWLSFARKLDDADLADAASDIHNAWGHRASDVTADDLATVAWR